MADDVVISGENKSVEEKKRERELAVNQVAFEESKRELDLMSEEKKKKMERREKIKNWIILFLIFAFTVLLAWKLF